MQKYLSESINMARKQKDNAILIEYRGLGTVSMEELAHALIADLHAIRDEFNVKFCSNVRLRIPVTNEYGEPLVPRRDCGTQVSKIDSFHYRPFCLDYDL